MGERGVEHILRRSPEVVNGDLCEGEVRPGQREVRVGVHRAAERRARQMAAGGDAFGSLRVRRRQRPGLDRRLQEGDDPLRDDAPGIEDPLAGTVEGVARDERPEATSTSRTPRRSPLPPASAEPSPT